jgi:hypothetical protein
MLDIIQLIVRHSRALKDRFSVWKRLRGAVSSMIAMRSEFPYHLPGGRNILVANLS